jgi:YggT family protein
MLLLVRLIDGYCLVILASVVLSWIQLPPDNPLVRFVSAATEPVLGPVRRILPDTGGFDFSAMLVLFALRIVRAQLIERAMSAF